MLNRLRPTLALATLLGAGLFAASSAMAGGVSWSIGINAPIGPGVSLGTVVSGGHGGVMVAPATVYAPVAIAPEPVYYPPQPVYVPPQPVYAPPVVYAPAPVYAPPPVVLRPPVYAPRHVAYLPAPIYRGYRDRDHDGDWHRDERPPVHGPQNWHDAQEHHRHHHD